jgi:hypothetical protein
VLIAVIGGHDLSLSDAVFPFWHGATAHLAPATEIKALYRYIFFSSSEVQSVHNAIGRNAFGGFGNDLFKARHYDFSGS